MSEAALVQLHACTSKVAAGSGASVQAGARICERGELRQASESATFRDLASTVPAALQHIMHPDYEVSGDALQLGVLLGQGEFGVVHRGRWHGTPVAVKVLHADRQIRVEELAAEIASLLKVHHPNVVQFLGAVTRVPPYLVVTEIMEGGSLEAALRRGTKFSLRRALELALDCARGLEYLHLPNPSSVMHRDLKPSNVMISGAGRAMSTQELVLDAGVAKLADFGLSKTLNAATGRADALRGRLRNDGSYGFEDSLRAGTAFARRSLSGGAEAPAATGEAPHQSHEHSGSHALAGQESRQDSKERVDAAQATMQKAITDETTSSATRRCLPEYYGGVKHGGATRTELSGVHVWQASDDVPVCVKRLRYTVLGMIADGCSSVCCADADRRFTMTGGTGAWLYMAEGVIYCSRALDVLS